MRSDHAYSGSPGDNTKAGMSLSMLNNPFFVQMKTGAQAEAKAAEVAAEGTGQDHRAESGAGRRGQEGR
ncbi:hypothetical protein ACFVYE_07850 [Streptomyces sp. NPDC058239]|uniref:hypothetical protein n=1 Tax=unclassified Streptomyces TaxID=2593676 RepID=UPI003646304E